jgi:hypothetical protein
MRKETIVREIVAVEYDVSAGNYGLVITHYADGSGSIAPLSLPRVSDEHAMREDPKELRGDSPASASDAQTLSSRREGIDMDSPFAKIERRLVDYFDHLGLGFAVESQGREWVAIREEVELSLTELAMALAADFQPAPGRGHENE